MKIHNAGVILDFILMHPASASGTKKFPSLTNCVELQNDGSR